MFSNILLKILNIPIIGEIILIMLFIFTFIVFGVKSLVYNESKNVLLGG
jgi:hypothetical protein